jgi:hypothetical protein
LLEEAESPVLPSPKSKKTAKTTQTLEHIGRLVTGHGVYTPFNTYLKNTRSAAVKIVIGAVVGAIAGAQAVAREDSLKIDPTLLILGTAMTGAGAASLLIVADVVGKRSTAARWLP